MASRAPLVIPALKKHTATVIWAHGLGDQSSGWAPVAENFRLRGKFEEVSFIFPNAPVSTRQYHGGSVVALTLGVIRSLVKV